MHVEHPELKSVGPDGLPCRSETFGLLARRPVRIGRVIAVGKGANEVERRNAGMIATLDEVHTTNERRLTECLARVFADMPVKRIQQETTYSRRQVFYLRRGEYRPHPEHLPMALASAAR
jgi:hypothetical protein